MSANPLRLKLFCGAGTATVVGASALLVATEARPPGAPLRPPVAGQSTSTTAAEPALTIPPSCGEVSMGGRNPSTGTLGGDQPASLSPAARQALTALRQAATRAQQRRILLGLSASDRQAVTALLHLQAASPAGCAKQPVPGASPGAQITPSAGRGGTVAPAIISYVS